MSRNGYGHCITQIKTNMNLRKIINKSGLSVERFAGSIYVSPRTVFNWLSGKPIPRQKQKQIIDTYDLHQMEINAEVETD